MTVSHNPHTTVENNAGSKQEFPLIKVKSVYICGFVASATAPAITEPNLNRVLFFRIYSTAMIPIMIIINGTIGTPASPFLAT